MNSALPERGRLPVAVAAALLAGLASPAQAGPTGGQVVAGQATIGTPANGALTITQTSQRTAINWLSFSIGANESVRFDQPSASAIALNRVLGQDPSQILGSLSANGQVFILNPNGVLFGAGAQVNVGGIVASTLDLSPQDFMDGRATFSKGAAAGAVVNQGSINAARGGYVALLGPQVRNEGAIVATLGTVALAAGEQVTLNLNGNSLLGLTVDRGAVDALVANKQLIRADAGQVILTAKAADNLIRSMVNNEGIVEARGLVEQNGVLRLDGGSVRISADAYYHDGRIDVSAAEGRGGSVRIATTHRHEGMAGGVIDASGREGGTIRIEGGAGMIGTSSKLLARGETQGGTIEMSAQGVYLLNATLDASAAQQGGTLHVGGGWQGSGNLPHAREVLVGAGTKLLAGGTRGGEAVLWSTDDSYHYGAIEARGADGNGGRIEVSSLGKLTLNGTMDAGPGGRVLLDPKNIVISDTPQDNIAWAMKVTQGSFGEPVLKDYDKFGSALALDGDLLAVGATGDYRGPNRTGAVHLFSGVSGDFSGLTWRKKLVSGAGAVNMPVVDSTDFGGSIALDGGRLAVGSSNDLVNGCCGTLGAVYLFDGVGSDFSGLTWRRTLTSSAGAAGMPVLPDHAHFGSAVALDGDRLAVGAWNYSTGLGYVSATATGAVYLFNGAAGDFSGLTWQKTVRNANSASGMPALAAGDRFGAAVALDGDRLAVGAPFDFTGGAARGAVYLFDGVGSNFSGLAFRVKLAPGAGAAGMPTWNHGNQFGSAVALDGDLLAVGAPNALNGDPAPGPIHGVYLFTGAGSANFTGLTWVKNLQSGTGAAGMPAFDYYYQFGGAIALDGDLLAVGAPQTSNPSDHLSVGAVQLFTGVGSDFSGLTWEKRLGHNTGATSHTGLDIDGRAGTAVALSGDLLAVGAPLDDSGGTDRGAVHLFNGVGSDFGLLAWQKKLSSGAGATGMVALADSDQFGTSVALEGGRLAVGAIGSDSGGTDRGAVHLFDGAGTDFSGLTWRKTVVSGSGATGMPALANGDQFGRAVALDGDRLAVGAPQDDTGGTNRGAVHLFTGASSSNFSSLDWEKRLASGAGATGMATLANDDQFGTAVALKGGLLAVGAPLDNTGGTDRGAVHLFNGVGVDFSGLAWQKKLASGSGADAMPALANGDRFGTAVSLDGGRLAVGAPGADDGGTDRGAVHLFNGTGGDFSGLIWRKKLASGNSTVGIPELEDNAGFGSALALDGDRLAVGSPGENGTHGAVHLLTGMASLVTGALGGGFASDPDQTTYLTPAQLKAVLDTGASLALQANNDISVDSAVVVNNAGGNGGALTLQAGNSIWINAGITTDNGNLTLIANDTLANGVVDAQRDPGEAWLYLAAPINAGTGSVLLELRDGAGKTESGSGPIVLDSITAGTIRAVNYGLTAGMSNIEINAGATLTATGTGDALVLAAASGGDFINYSGAGALATPNGRWLVYSASIAASTEEGLTGAAGGATPRFYNMTYAGNAPASIAAGNHLIYSEQPALTVTADNKNRVYGDANPTLTANLAGFVVDDGVTDTLTSAGITGAAGLSTSAVAGSAVSGSPYAIAATAGTLASGAGYAFSFTDGSLAVSARPITVTADTGQTKVYGNVDPALTYGITTGNLAGTDTLSGALARAAGENVGSYAINQGTLANGNYAITYAGANFGVTARPITVTADAGQTKVYGNADPAFSYGITTGNLVGLDALSGALARAAGENVGNYAIAQGTLTDAANPNYLITYAGASFGVTARPITVTADAGQTKIYGNVDPTLTYGITTGNLVGTDALSGALARAAGENVGSYAINQGTLANSNYAIAFAGNDFSITPLPVPAPSVVAGPPPATPAGDGSALDAAAGAIASVYQVDDEPLRLPFGGLSQSGDSRSSLLNIIGSGIQLPEGVE